MLRENLSPHEAVDGFRWRSHEVSRIEGFSDAVFGFAVTLLIVSLEVPKTSTELFATMRGFGAFLVTFFMLAAIWYAQHLFFRRYGLADRVTVILNLALLFTILFFVYPLKFLFTVLLGDPTMRHAKVMTAHGLEPAILPGHRPWIYLIYGVGFVAIFAVFSLLYRHAYNQREKLGLNEFEAWETQHSLRRFLLAVGLGSTYLGVALLELIPKSNTTAINGLSAVLLLIVAGLFLKMFRMRRHRSRKKREWLAR
ncbi:MAG TPA: TMEM175 family protein [Thermoanaerobaculia bacterium]|nr:TMEM175 family protein [Thermoanaerobaculia bacterium]